MNKNISLNFFSIEHSLFKNECLPIFIYLIIAVIFSIIILLLSYLLVIQKPYIEKLTSYECGFEPYEDSRHKFDVKFYLVGILFVVFDIETMFLLLWSVSLSQLNLLGFWCMLDFIVELSIGFIYIWYIGVLDWT